MQFDAAAALTIAVTALVTGAVTALTSWLAARRGVRDELTKARNSQGFRRQLRWYEHARREMRKLGEYRTATGLAHVFRDPDSDNKNERDALFKLHREAVATAHELILGAAVYASHETVSLLSSLAESMTTLEPHLYFLTDSLAKYPERRRWFFKIQGVDVSKPDEELSADAEKKTHEVHAQMEVVLTHLVNETRRLHGYPDLGNSALLTLNAIRDALRA